MPSFTRRAAIGAITAASYSRVLGANDRIAAGIIGAGGRGTFDMNEVAHSDLNAEIAGVCDVWRPNRERAAQWAGRTFKREVKQTSDYREMLASKDIDAVIIATPDFGHSTILKAAVEAGKDVYCEKPFGIEFTRAKAAYLAIQKSRSVVQVGTQRRSEAPTMAAAKFVQSGALGKVTRVAVDVAFHEPRWVRDSSNVQQSDVDWNAFLLDTPQRAFDAKLLRQWQLYPPMSNGIAGLWMCHFVDLVHWFLEDPYPASVVANGGVFLWQDGRSTSDVFHALLVYPKGFLFSFSMALTNASGNRNAWYGTRGTLEGSIEKVEWTASGEGSKAKDRLTETTKLTGEKVNSHMQNFLECVRSRQTPRADYHAGFSHAVAGIMSATALEQGRRVQFDRAKLELV